MNQMGRSILEMIGILAIIGLLSYGGVYAFTTAMNKRQVNEILEEIHQKSVVISDALHNKKFSEAEKLNDFLEQFNKTVGKYDLAYKFPDDGDLTNKNYSIKIVQKDGKPVHGKMCQELMRAMIQQKIITDIAITIQDDEDEDGISETISLRLNGLSVDLSALCGKSAL